MSEATRDLEELTQTHLPLTTICYYSNPPNIISPTLSLQLHVGGHP